MPRLKTDRILEDLATLSGWSHEDDGKRDVIKKSFTFKNFSESWAFMNRVALLAEKSDHHPEWFNVYHRVDIVLSTHDAGGVSEKDIAIAREIEKILNA